MELNSDNLDVVILAGGLGTRVRDVLGNKQKVIAEVGGRPFLYLLLDQIWTLHVTAATIATGYKSMSVSNTLGHRYRDMKLSYSEESHPLGTGGALKKAAATLNKEWLLVMNGDSFIDLNFNSFMSWHTEQNEPRCSIVLTKVQNPNRHGLVKVNASGIVLGFVEKPLDPYNQPGLINAGIYLFHRSTLASLPRSTTFSIEQDFFAVNKDITISGYVTDGAFIDIGTPESLAQATTFLAHNATPRESTLNVCR